MATRPLGYGRGMGRIDADSGNKPVGLVNGFDKRNTSSSNSTSLDGGQLSAVGFTSRPIRSSQQSNEDWDEGSSKTFAFEKNNVKSSFNDADSWDDNSGASSSATFVSSSSRGFEEQGGRSGGCFKCGQDGHLSRDCPNASSLPRKNGCFKCGQDGHMSRDCPNAGQLTKKSGCFKCRQEGHMSRDCPNADQSSRKSGCFKCGEEGHVSRDCPNADKTSKKSGCFKCGEDGHMSRDCPSADKTTKKSGCFKCGEDGHMSRDCPNAESSGKKEKPREVYVPPPPPETEDEMFQSIAKGINFDKYDQIPVEVTGRNPVGYITDFDQAGFFPTCLENIRKAKYTVPTPVQKYAVPIIMAGRDLMACAQTGSGKTAAFLLPVITGMIKNGLTTSSFAALQQPQTIVVAPTRELAIQIYQDSRKFAYNTDVRSVVVYGGTSTSHQIRQVEGGANIVVGTPGRLLDVINRGKINLEKVQYLILDEADRMLDMGFEPEVRKLVHNMGLPSKMDRQTLMFSATFPEEIQKLAAEFLNDYLFVTVGRVGGANTDVEQTFFEVERLQKREKLSSILSDAGTDKTLVFVEQKRNADFLASYLSQCGFPTTSIHGDRLQREREEALKDFKIGRAPVLIATNVAARGLDIPDVKHVVNYDLPQSIDEYVHRIGRTGRCGNLGKATSFYSSDTDSALAPHLVRILQEAYQEVPDWLAGYASDGGGNYSGSSFKSRFASKDIRKTGYNMFQSAPSGGGDDDAESWD